MLYDLSHVDPKLRHDAETRFSRMFASFPDKLLGVDTNAKTIKGEKLGVKTAILYLAPATMSGQNVCPLAEIAQCAAPCLFTAGRGAMSNVAASRLRKTLYFQQYRAEFLAQLRAEIAALQNKASREGWKLLVRLNGTSDIRWENYGIPQAFPDVQFYDYTKIANRKNVPANYDLTFSYSGVKAFAPHVAKAREAGMRVAVVFRNRAIVERMLANAETFEGMPVVDGDDTDVRHLDPHGAAVALYAKGAAKRDASGFVVG